ncbi:MAG: cation:proton antiporter [Myxococcota bacterium]|nr:cation:proton antiporter [Myxococcota bacterium]
MGDLHLHPDFTVALALVAGVVAQSLARHLRVPGIVLLLLAGVGLGPDGLGWIDPHSVGGALTAILDVAVAVILFEGGLNLEFSRLRHVQTSVRRLVSSGGLVTVLGGALAVRSLLGWDWTLAILFGSLVMVTGPTVIGPLVTELRLKSRVATVLEAEGVLIDPIGALFAVLVLALVLSPDLGSAAIAGGDLLVRIGFGLASGGFVGLLLAGLLRVRRLIPEGLENIFTLAVVLVLYQGCEQVISHSGILAVTIAGAVLGNLPTPISRELREFKDQLTVMLIGLLFVMLAADVRYEHVAALGVPGVLVVAALVFVVRPAGVWLSTHGSGLGLRERLFIAWVAPRGIVAAAIASVTANALESEGLPGGIELRALVFLTIAGTVLLAGLTAGPVASLLGVRLPSREGVAILGAHRLGLALAEELRAAGSPVVFIDSNPQNCRLVEESGFTVVYGNALEERILQRARFEEVRVAAGLTANQTVNAVFVDRARELFHVPEGVVAVQRIDSGFAKELVDKEQAQVAFDGAHDMSRWEVRGRRGSVTIEHRRYAADAVANPPDSEADSAAPLEERYAIVAIKRGSRVEPMSAAFTPKEGDVATVAVHDGEGDAARARLAALGWLPVEEEEGGDAPEAQASAT